MPLVTLAFNSREQIYKLLEVKHVPENVCVTITKTVSVYLTSEETYRHRVEVDGQKIQLEILDTAGQVSYKNL